MYIYIYIYIYIYVYIYIYIYKMTVSENYDMPFFNTYVMDEYTCYQNSVRYGIDFFQNITYGNINEQNIIYSIRL